ncbi:hypothetical protein MHU86_15 [Fragilaria crotonensis]|nr:hypothetical protein MHU86_15 [Fragilaria crotonensis]
MCMNATAAEPDLCDKHYYHAYESNSEKKRVCFDFQSTLPEKDNTSRSCMNAMCSIDSTKTREPERTQEVASESSSSQSDCVIPGSDGSLVHAIGGSSIRKSALKESRYVTTMTTPTPKSEAGILADEISDTDIIVGDGNVGVLDLPNTGNRRFLVMVNAHIRTFSKLKKKDRLRMAQATARVVHSVGGRFLSVSTSTGLFHEIDIASAWSNSFTTYSDALLTLKRNASMRRLRRVIQQQELLMCNTKAGRSASDGDSTPAINVDVIQSTVSTEDKRSQVETSQGLNNSE